MNKSHDLILAVLITFVILASTLIIVPVVVVGVAYLSLLLCSDSTMRGGAKSKKFAKSAKSAESKKSATDEKIKKAAKKIGETVKIMLKSYTHVNQIRDPIKCLAERYGQHDLDEKEYARQIKYRDIAKEVYEAEGQDPSIFDIDIEKVIRAYGNDYVEEKNNKKSHTIVKKLVKQRELTEDYPISTHNSYLKYGIKDMEYTPIDESQYEKDMLVVYKYAVLTSIRQLNDKEKAELVPIITKFNEGRMTQKTFKINFFSHAPIYTDKCRAYKFPMSYSPLYKKLHWGQRKLLLSEIDFFTRVAHDMGVEKFRNQRISVVYPGSAHGDKLMMQMEMFPNVVYYLWDPARFNTILYIADFLRRKLPLNFKYTEKELEVAKKFVGRVFINMELPDDIYLKYHYNSDNGKISDNYGPEYGFFLPKSAEYFLKHKKDSKDESPILFVSDIRMFTNTMAYDLLLNNHIHDYHDLLALRVSSEKSKHIDYKRDMNLQRDWFDMVKASYGLFKFKLKSRKFSLYDAQYNYLDGDIILQAWAPVASTETRLYVTPKHKKDAYYNVKSYTDKCKTFNALMRVSKLSHVKLSELGIDVCDGSYTIGDIWKPFLPTYLIGMDAVIETGIVYDFLLINKDKKNIKHTDIMLVISDLTQSLLDRSNYTNILAYLDDDADAQNILQSRRKHHDAFTYRLDYNSRRSDYQLCTINRNPHKGKRWRSQTIRN